MSKNRILLLSELLFPHPSVLTGSLCPGEVRCMFRSRCGAAQVEVHVSRSSDRSAVQILRFGEIQIGTLSPSFLSELVLRS